MKGSALFLTFLLLEMSHGAVTFSNVGDTQVWLSDEQLSYQGAKDKCGELGSALVEFRSAEEWTQVRGKSKNKLMFTQVAPVQAKNT